MESVISVVEFSISMRMAITDLRMLIFTHLVAKVKLGSESRENIVSTEKAAIP